MINCMDKYYETDIITELKSTAEELNSNLIDMIISMVKFLRNNNYVIPPSSLLMLCQMIKGMNILSQRDFINISKCLFCKTPLEYEGFEKLIDDFFMKQKIYAIEELVQKEKEILEENKARVENEIKKEMDQYSKKLKEEKENAIKEVLSGNYKVFKEQKKFIDNLEDKVQKDLEDIILDSANDNKSNTLNNDKNNNKSDTADGVKAVVSLDKEKIGEYISEDKLHFDSIKKMLEEVLLTVMEKDNDTSKTELLLLSASTLSKIETTYNKKLSDLKKKAKEKEFNYNEKLAKNKAEFKMSLEELNRKYRTKEHKNEDVEGRRAVIEILKNRDKTVNQLTGMEYQSLLYYIKLNAPKFRTKITSSMKKASAKRFDYKKTSEDSVKYNGTPLNIFYKKPKVKKYKLFCFFDISGSVKKSLKVVTSFIFELNSVFNGGVEIYGFVNRLINFTEEYKNGTLEDVLQQVSGHRGYSDYYTSLKEFYEECYGRLDRNTIILYFGDARNNQNKPGDEILNKLNNKIKYSCWLNPESSEKWDTNDSIIGVYTKQVNKVYEISTVGRLIDFLNDFSVNNKDRIILKD